MGESRFIKLSQMTNHSHNPDVPHTWAVASRPTLLFVVAYALNVTPHEIVHALTSYSLGFNSTQGSRFSIPSSVRLLARPLEEQ
jgi:hypothetical protein